MIFHVHKRQFLTRLACSYYVKKQISQTLFYQKSSHELIFLTLPDN